MVTLRIFLSQIVCDIYSTKNHVILRTNSVCCTWNERDNFTNCTQYLNVRVPVPRGSSIRLENLIWTNFVLELKYF